MFWDGYLILEVQFEDGNRAGQNVRFSLQMCLEKGLLQLV